MFPYMKLAKTLLQVAPTRVEMGMGTDIDKGFLTEVR